jgi:hypothetical protein
MKKRPCKNCERLQAELDRVTAELEAAKLRIEELSKPRNLNKWKDRTANLGRNPIIT